MLQIKPLEIINNLDESWRTESLFEHVHAQSELPLSARSPLRPEQASTLSPGISNVVADLLRGRLTIKTNAARATLVQGRSGHVALSVQQPTHLSWAGATGEWQETIMLALACALTTPHFPVIRSSLLQLTQALSEQGQRYPLRSTLYETRDPATLQALAILCDSVDAEVRQAEEEGRLTAATQSQTRIDEEVQDLNLAQLLYPKPPRESTHLQRLRRLIARGGAALLVGPPGTFKTETAKTAAVESGAALVIAKGSPGVEDRDFLGGVYPAQQGPTWVDGPISRAFVSAATRKTVLLIDEALRYLPENLGVLIGAMDTVSAAELRAMQLGDAQEGRFYVLPLPNGEHLMCPAQNLTWLLTTNMGADHHQQTDRLDAALLSRLDLELYFGVPDKEKVLGLYASVSTPELAELGYQAEAMTRRLLKEDRRCLERPLEARKTIALLREAHALTCEGLSPHAALREAFSATALPYCCKRDEQGQAEFGMSQMLLQKLTHDVLGGKA